MGERCVRNAEVMGSNPTISTRQIKRAPRAFFCIKERNLYGRYSAGFKVFDPNYELNGKVTNFLYQYSERVSNRKWRLTALSRDTENGRSKELGALIKGFEQQ